MDRTFGALADATRRGLLAQLSSAPPEGLPVTQLAEPHLRRMSLAAVSKHLRVLADAGLVKQTRDGRVRRCRLDPTPLRDADQWLAFYRQFWTQQLDKLAAYVESVK